MNYQEKLEKLLSRYSSEDKKLVKDTVDMLCATGIANGCYQDYGVLVDVVNVLTIFEEAVAERKN